MGSAGPAVLELEQRLIQLGDNPGTPNTTFDTLLESSDVVSLHVPLIDSTRHIAGLTEESQRRVGEVTAANIRAALAGAQ